jgi:hypothetical protein
LETDIEKAREEGNWKKVIELATQLKDKGERGGWAFSSQFCGSLSDPDPPWIPISLGQWIPGGYGQNGPSEIYGLRSYL